MPRGFFTQSAVVLFDRIPQLDEVAASLEHLSPRQRQLGEGAGSAWMNASSDLLVTFRPEVRGEIAVDVLDKPWPDTMGDPESEPDLFGAWTMGSFGPLVYPGNLERSVQQAVAFDNAPAVVAKHCAFVRLRTTYVIGAGEDAKVVPDDHDAMGEMLALLAAGRAVLELPGALAYFDPNGEVLVPRDEFDAALQHADQAKVPPLDLFSHVRFFRVDENWSVMDTVGLDRFFMPDLELAFTNDLDPNQAAGFLRSLTLYMMTHGPILNDGATLDGPKGPLKATIHKESLAEPPRPVVRLVPDGVALPEGL